MHPAVIALSRSERLPTIPCHRELFDPGCMHALFDYGFRKARHDFDRAKQPPGAMQAAPTQVVMPAKGNAIQFHETADQTLERLQQLLSKRGESAEAFAERRGATRT
jgi:hypothetical protein